MAATSLKISPQLKRRVSALVDGTSRTAHAFMVAAIEQAAQDEELRRRFGAEADAAERDAMKSVRALDATEVFDYFEARSRGASVRMPRLKSWRKSA